LRKGQRQALRFQGFGKVPAKAVAQQGHKRLRASVDPQALAAKREGGALVQESARRKLAKQRFAEDEGQAGIAAAHRMTHPVLLDRIEEQHLVYFGDSLILSNAAHVDATIRKHQLRG
jgi:hypothetical protein